MLTFKEHFNFVARIKNLFSFVFEKIKDLLVLSFGQKKTIKIDLSKMSNQILSEDVDLKSHVGYYAEYTTAYNLSLLIQKNGGNLTTSRSQPSYLKKLMEQKKKTILTLNLKPSEKKKVPSELERMNSAGILLSKVIFQDVILKGNDYNSLQFDIELTGDSEKGSSKADLILTVGKMSKKEVVDRICASIKAYEKSKINLDNATFISLFKKLFYDNPKSWGNKIENFIVDFVNDYGSEKEIRKLYALQNTIKTKMESGLSKEDARLYSKTVQGEVIEVMVKIFNEHYSKHKKEVNTRILKILGFDGADDFYAAIGEANKQKYISSRQSEEMKQMLQDLNQGFNIVFERNGKTRNANMFFYSPNGKKLITKSNLTLTDTGKDGKTNAFVDVSDFIKK
jgi:hypothetical protein